MNETVTERVWRLAESLVTHEGLEIVDIEFHRENRGLVLRLYLDQAGGGGGVSLDDLTRVSRQLGDILDVHDAVPGSYNLEVSSPGINRRLRSPDHFRRYVGKKVRVRSAAPLNGRRSFVGVLAAVDEEGIAVSDAEGSHRILFTDIAQANYESDF